MFNAHVGLHCADFQMMLHTKMNMVLMKYQKPKFQMLASLNSRRAGEQSVQDGLQLEPCTSQEEFRKFEDKLQDKQFFQQVVIQLFQFVREIFNSEGRGEDLESVTTTTTPCGLSQMKKSC